jgi:hypothetical protein
MTALLEVRIGGRCGDGERRAVAENISFAGVLAAPSLGYPAPSGMPGRGTGRVDQSHFLRRKLA